MKGSILLKLIVSLTVIFLYLRYSFPKSSSGEMYLDNNKNKYLIMIDVNAKQLSVIDMELQETIKVYPICTGRKKTPSPLGNWVIVDKGRKKEDYFGTRWMGLNVPWGGYGIHGTDRPSSIGRSLSNGCFRMHNRHVEELYSYIPVGTVVIIEGGPYGPFGNGFRVIKPGDFGSDVYEVQRLMKLKGYFPGVENGIYKQDMIWYVLKFRKENNLKITNDIDDEFYKALGIKLIEWYVAE